MWQAAAPGEALLPPVNLSVHVKDRVGSHHKERELVQPFYDGDQLLRTEQRTTPGR